MMIDTGSMIIFAVTMVATLLVQMYLKNTYNRWGKIANTAGLTGAEVARVVLDSNGLEEVPVEKVRGVLTDHYDPFKRVVRLSAVNYEQASVAGAAVAAHEVGH
ncbi:MAG: zinc metallopeptidase, partial [Deinococcales bacterium]|nr:zinc metallopeptidase [Deinococcales bacterium]